MASMDKLIKEGGREGGGREREGGREGGRGENSIMYQTHLSTCKLAQPCLKALLQFVAEHLQTPNMVKGISIIITF